MLSSRKSTILRHFCALQISFFKPIPNVSIYTKISKPNLLASFQCFGTSRQFHDNTNNRLSLQQFLNKNSSQQLQATSTLLSRSSSVNSQNTRGLASKKGALKEPVTWKSLFITAGIGGFILLVLYYIKQERELKLAKERSKALGKASLGGPWTLVDHNNQVKSNTDFFGQWVLLYFGFTHCPDICPDEIEKMINVVETLGKNSYTKPVTPLFITVDPERDSVQAVKNYVNEFSPKLIGLTGDKEKVHEATRAYRVYYSTGPKDEDNDYIVDHTIIMYLLNPSGDFVDYYGQNRNVEEISSSISLHMKKYDLMN